MQFRPSVSGLHWQFVVSLLPPEECPRIDGRKSCVRKHGPTFSFRWDCENVICGNVRVGRLGVLFVTSWRKDLQQHSCSQYVRTVRSVGRGLWRDFFFLFATAMSRPALHPSKRPVQWVPTTLSLGAHHSPPSNSEVKNAWTYTSVLTYAFMAWF